ncbi:MAG: transposase [Tunicatimonas sp.]
MEYFINSSFGQMLVSLFSSHFTAPSLQSFMLLAQGWSLAGSHHTITTYLRLSGAVKYKHFSRFYAFFGGAFYRATDQLWVALIQLSTSLIAQDEVLYVQVDDGTRKKNGRCIEGASHYRNGAGTARQEYRSLWGLNWIWATLSVPLKRWPGYHLCLPVGLKLYLKKPVAQQLQESYYSRSALARQIIDRLALTLSERSIIVSADGGYATKEFLRELPSNVGVTGRFSVSSKLHQLPGPRPKGKRGPKPKKGALIGTAKTLVNEAGWQPHPNQKHTWIKSYQGLWHSVLPGRLISVVILKRDQPTGRQKSVEAFFSTDPSTTCEELLAQYTQRWNVEINIRDANAFYGFGQDQCQNYRCVVGVNTFRALLAACRSLWFVQQADHSAEQYINLVKGRPWYRKKRHPTQLDVQWMFKEMLAQQAITPTPAFIDDVTLFNPNRSQATAKAA